MNPDRWKKLEVERRLAGELNEALESHRRTLFDACDSGNAAPAEQFSASCEKVVTARHRWVDFCAHGLIPPDLA